MSRIDEIRGIGLQISSGLRYIDFFFSMEALVRLPYIVFPEYVPDGNREYNRGEVIRIGHEKYLLQNWGKIDPARPPPENPLCKLFRDSRRYEWVREEYCLKGFERSYNGKWYRVKADRVDDATPPPNNANAWEELLE